ncbi:hypothetical protein ACF05L_09245 [Streptomyces bobili]|uniref:hypothetical protein n=1 Tax=Streptomyces bobili TaxID=67280 RepID=UPI0036FE4ACB
MNASYVLVNRGSGKALDVSGASMAQHPPVGAQQRMSRHHGVHRGTVPVAQRG